MFDLIAEASVSTAQAFVDRFTLITKQSMKPEQQFWGRRWLSLTPATPYSAENLIKTDLKWRIFYRILTLKQAEALRKQLLDGNAAADSDLVKTLDIIIRTCRCYDMSSAPEAKRSYVEETGKMESGGNGTQSNAIGLYSPRWSFHLVDRS
jgi:hypothetical protein